MLCGKTDPYNTLGLSPMCFKIHLWHASPNKFTEFDFSLIGNTSLKYGYGIYFSREKDKAIDHVPGARYIYRVDLSRAVYRGLLNTTENLAGQSDIVKELAQELKDVGTLSSWNELGMLYTADGKSLYKAACEHASSASGVSYEKEGVQLLLSAGILGAITKDNNEEIVTLFCPRTAKIADSGRLYGSKST